MDKKMLSESDTAAIEELFMGRKVIEAIVFDEPKDVGHWTKASGGLVLDNGQFVYIIPNEGGCICGAGDYFLSSLNRVDNIITRVEVVAESEREEEDIWYEGPTSYKIFVLAGHEKINLMTVDGDDGNGYYGTGYELLVVDGFDEEG